jgi:hypothetical protein
VAFKPVTLKIRIETEEDADQFLLGLIVAQSNNSSHLFKDLVEGTNAVLEGARRDRLDAAMEARRAAGMP